MARFSRFEEIEAWKKARELTKAIYLLTADGTFARDYGLRDQIRRAAVSVMSNIAEGFERDGNKEFRQFLSMAKGSLGEVQSQLYVAFDVQYLNTEQFDSVMALATDTGHLIGGLLRYLANTDQHGYKYR